eukprot:2056541-Prorocentrum_lima.AAC.1
MSEVVDGLLQEQLFDHGCGSLDVFLPSGHIRVAGQKARFASQLDKTTRHRECVSDCCWDLCVRREMNVGKG